MDNYNELEIERLIERVGVLEQKIQYLSRMLVQIGESMTAGEFSPAYKMETEEAENAAVEPVYDSKTISVGISNKQGNVIGILSETEEIIKPEDNLPDEEKAFTGSYRKFVEKYSSGTCDFDLYLDIARDLIKDLKRNLDWKQVPDTVKEQLYLEEAYDSNMYYADCEQVEDDFLYFVAPAEPDAKYEQRDFIRLALPNFFDIIYSSDLDGKLLKLIKPAVFLQDNNGRYILKTKGQLVLTR